MARQLTDVRFRGARCVVLLQLAWAGDATHDAKHDAAFVHTFVGRWVEDIGQRPTWTARVDGSLQGFLSRMRVHSLSWPGREDSSWLHIAALYVQPAHAEQNGYRLTRLDAAEQAAPLYRQLGYARDSQSMWLDLRYR